MFCNNPTIEEKVSAELNSYQDKTELIKSVNAVSFELPLKNCSPELIDKFRIACSRWDVHLKPPSSITSHRPLIGPIIVMVKKAIYPILRNLLKDFTREQREFNAASLAIMAEMTQKK